MKENYKLEDVAINIGTEFAKNTSAVKIWGNGAKFDGQEMPLSAKVLDGMMIRFL